MALTERLALLVTLDANGAIKGLNDVGKAADRNLSKTSTRIDRLGQGMQKAGAGMLAGAGLAAVGLYKAGQSAANLEQAVGGTEAVFKDASGTIDRFAKDSARNMGLSETAFRTATTSIGGQLKALGFNQDEAADKAVELTGVAADLAATYGGTTKDAVAALGAAFRGEADPAEQFNLRLNQNTVNAKAVALGLAESTSQVDAQAKAQATLALITEQSADAQGQFARETGSASGSMAIAAAEFENAKASLGESVAPIMASVASGLADVTDGFKSANDATGGLVSKLATFGTIGLGVAGGLSLVVGKIITMRENLGPLIGKLRGAEGGFSRLGKVAGAVGAGLAVAALVDYERGLSDITIEVDELAAALGNLDSANKQQVDELIRVADAAGQLDDVVSQTADSNIAAAERLVDYAEANGLAADEVSKLRDIIEDKRATDVQAAKDQDTNSAALANAVAPTEELEGATAALTEQVDKTAEAYDGLLSATLAQFDSNIAYRRSIDSTEDALAGVVETLQEHGSESEEYRRSLLDAEDALLDQAAAAAELMIQTAEAGGVTLDAAAKTDIHRDALARVRDSLAPGSPLRAALDGYIGQLDAVPENVRTTVNANTTDAERKIITIQKLLGLIPSTVGVRVDASYSGPSYRRAEGGPIYRASGGPSGSDTVNAWLTPGEFVMKKSAVDSIGLAAMSHMNETGRVGGGGSTTLVVQIGDRTVDEIVVDALGRAESRNGAVRVRTRTA